MSETEDWLSRYAESHSELASPLVYWFAAPLVVLGTVGLLWSLPVPDEFYAISPLVNWGSLFLMATTVYYFIISVPLAIGMLPFVIGVASIQTWLEATQHSLLRVATGFLIAGIIGLLLSRRRGPTAWLVFQDLQLMMIGPAWLLSVLYRRMGIPI
jgi:uncharacterized membrane protein YGL010W